MSRWFDQPATSRPPWLMGITGPGEVLAEVEDPDNMYNSSGSLVLLSLTHDSESVEPIGLSEDVNIPAAASGHTASEGMVLGIGISVGFVAVISGSVLLTRWYR